MAELQTSYTDTIAHGYPGMVANGEDSNRISRTCEDAAGIAFGLPVARGSGDHGCTGTITTAADATHIALTGWVADETVTDGICRIAKR
jgi:hypothetical protein